MKTPEQIVEAYSGRTFNSYEGGKRFLVEQIRSAMARAWEEGSNKGFASQTYGQFENPYLEPKP